MSAWRRILGVVRRTAEGSDPLPDAELLTRFAATRDQAAFEVLVWRHAAMVLGVCRRAVRDEHLAEDAFQAVFLVLARKAGRVRGSNLAGWLFRVARRVSLRTARRLPSTQPMAVDPAAEALPDRLEQAELRTLLDDEIARLPERFRMPVLLCYLGGQSTDDAAKRLGVPRGTILSRLSTARTRLAARLTRRGVTVPAVAVAATPAAVVNATVRSSLAFAARFPALSTIPANLAEGVLRTMTVTKLIPVAALVVVTTAVSATSFRSTAEAVAAVPLQSPKVGKAAQPPSGANNDRDRRNALEAERESLQKLASNLLAQIEQEERKILDLQRAQSSDGDSRAAARLDRQLALLEAEVFASEKELAGHQVRRDILKQKLESGHSQVPEPDPAEIEKDVRIRDLEQKVAEAERRFTEWKSQVAGSLPQGTAMEKAIAERKKAANDMRVQLREEQTKRLIDDARKANRAKLDDAEVSLLVAQKVLDLRKRTREELEKRLTQRESTAQRTEPLVEALKPKKEMLAKLHNQLAQLEVELPPTPVAPAPGGVEAKLDLLIREVEMLKKEVHEMKKR